MAPLVAGHGVADMTAQRFRNFHEGEARIQAESGVDTTSFDAGVDEPFRPEFHANEVQFVNRRTFSVAASVDCQGRPWASPLIGLADRLFSVESATTVLITPQDIGGDPLFDNIDATGELGVLYFDPSRRRRAKSLGKATSTPDRSINYRMHRHFGLCTKYIFKRQHDMTDKDLPAVGTMATTVQTPTDCLDANDRTQLESADTVFLASHHTEHGADATHRGGPPGFVTVIDDVTLSMPDYLGNGMFQTLGNLLLDDRIGLLSVDFNTGRTLQFTGHGRIQASQPDDLYSTRTLLITIDEIRTTWPSIGHWTDVEPFPLRPGLTNPATPLL